MLPPIDADLPTTRVDLHSGWRLRAAASSLADVPSSVADSLPIPASVPGTVHTDLLAAGLIPDPYLDTAELSLEWIGRVDWEYELRFDNAAVGDEEAELEFDGLDTVATVILNDVVVARTENMHRRYRVPVTAALRDGVNVLVVRFASPLAFAEAERDRLGDLPRQYPHPFNFIRKAACNFGWDWGPALVGAGIWRPVRLVRHSTRRIVEVRPRATVVDGTGIVEFEVVLDRATSEPLGVRAEVDESVVDAVVPAGEDRVRVRVERPDAALWWPRGFGEPALSTVAVTLNDPVGVIADVWRDRVGFRTVELDTAPDADGAAFVLRVNGLPVPVRGANWIPDDCFFPRVTEDRLRRRIGQAVDAELNLLRVWGGGVYEGEDFYRICDEEGVLVWQDFLFACAAYPEDDRHAREIEAEARDNVARLIPHPSLVLWNGNNENIWGEQDWDWRPAIGDRSWGLGYYLDLLPRVVAETDPDRPYWPGSPYSGSLDVHPNDDGYGTKHIWDAWNEKDFTVYRDYRPRFVAEFGWQAPPTWSTMTRAISDDPLAPDSPGMRHHQKAADGVAKLERGIARHLPEPVGIDDWHAAGQLIQSRAVRTGIEWFRSLRPLCTGTILWQLNDCWPVTSWAVVDGDGRRKPAWYGLRAASRPRLVTLQPAGDGLELVLVNDTLEGWLADAVVRRLSVDGEILAEAELVLEAPALGVARAALAGELARPGDPGRELLVAEARGAEGARSVWWFASDRDLELQSRPFEAEASRDGDDVILTLRATGAARDVLVFPDRIAAAAEADDNDFDLLPGEVRAIRISGIPVGREPELLAPPVLRHAAQLVANSRAIGRA